MTAKTAIIFFLASTFLAVSTNVQAAAAGDIAPGWQLQSFSGTDIAFPQVAEEAPSIVLFWASWCPYGKAFMPYLDKNPQDSVTHGVKVLAINIKEDGARWCSRLNMIMSSPVCRMAMTSRSNMR